MDPKDLDEKIKEFLDKLPEGDDYDKLFDEFTDTISQAEIVEGDAEQESVNYKLGYDAGFVEGFQQGQLITNYDSDITSYNDAIDDILNVVGGYEFNYKDEIVGYINQLRRA